MKISRFLLAVYFALFLHRAGAADVYALFNYPEQADIYRIFSTQAAGKTFGKQFSTPPAKAFYIDNNQQFRLVHSNQTTTFKTSARPLCRQVFDGLPVLADKGWHGYAQYQDQRDQLLPDSAGKPVFRSTGAPFSPGPGFPVDAEIAHQYLLAGEIVECPGHNWYEIPNSSWYQTWFKADETSNSSYLIFYDNWEEREYILTESIWSGQPVTNSRVLHPATLYDYRLQRAMLDGAMETLASAPALRIVFNNPVKMAFCHGINMLSNEFDTFLYSWYGDAPGTLSTNGQNFDFQIVFASKHKEARFPVLLDRNRLLVMGTDLLHDWLTFSQINSEDSECSSCVCSTMSDGNRAVMVYSASNQKLYRFIIDAEAGIDFAKTTMTQLAFDPAAFTVDHEGRVFIGSFSLWPESLTESEDLIMAIEAIDIYPDESTEEEIRGRILLAQQCYFNVYRVDYSRIEPLWYGNFKAGHRFFQCEFKVKSPPSVLTRDVRILFELTRQPGNSLSEIKSVSEEEQPGQFIMPDQVFMSLSN